MAVNPTTGIDRDVDRFVVFLPGQTNSVNTNAQWPRLDGGPISGGFTNGDLYYKKVTVDPPQYDHRYSLNTTFGKVDTVPTPPPGYPVGTWQASYELVLRPLETLLDQIESAFQAEVRKQFPDTENPATLLLAAKALAKRQTGVVLTAEEITSLDAVTSVGDAVDQLVARRQELINSATAGEDYDQTIWPVLS